MHGVHVDFHAATLHSTVLGDNTGVSFFNDELEEEKVHTHSLLFSPSCRMRALTVIRHQPLLLLLLLLLPPKVELQVLLSDNAKSVGSAGDGSSLRPADCDAETEDGTAEGSVVGGVAGGANDKDNDDGNEDDDEDEDEDSLSLYSSATPSLAPARELDPLTRRGHKHKRMTAARTRAHEVEQL